MQDVSRRKGEAINKRKGRIIFRPRYLLFEGKGMARVFIMQIAFFLWGGVEMERAHLKDYLVLDEKNSRLFDYDCFWERLKQQLGQN